MSALIHCLSLNLVRKLALECKTVAETYDLLYVLVKFKILVMLNFFAADHRFMNCF